MDPSGGVNCRNNPRWGVSRDVPTNAICVTTVSKGWIISWRVSVISGSNCKSISKGCSAKLMQVQQMATTA